MAASARARCCKCKAFPGTITAPTASDGPQAAIRFAEKRKKPAPYGAGISRIHPFRQALPPDAKPLDEGLVAGLFLALEVVEQLAALGDHHQQATARMVVFLVRLEVLGERGDAAGEDGHLNFWRTGVAFLGGIFLHQTGLFFLVLGRSHSPDLARHFGFTRQQLSAQPALLL